jgi:hypothetical protein
MLYLKVLINFRFRHLVKIGVFLGSVFCDVICDVGCYVAGYDCDVVYDVAICDGVDLCDVGIYVAK